VRADRHVRRGYRGRSDIRGRRDDRHVVQGQRRELLQRHSRQSSNDGTVCEHLVQRLASIGLTAGRIRTTHIDRSILVGLSAKVHPRLRIRGGWRYHNPLNDENALSEVFIGAGYLFRSKN
jgi:hypothetical protein